jgi:predicted metal-dependent phosphotriesterase family hydrolase
MIVIPTLTNPEFLLNNKEKIVEELKGLKALGCSTMVDTMPVNAGRNCVVIGGSIKSNKH